MKLKDLGVWCTMYLGVSLLTNAKHVYLYTTGFEATMNEWSAYMNLAYRYLSSLSTAHSTVFHPYIDWWPHRITTDNLQRSVEFPIE